MCCAEEVVGQGREEEEVARAWMGRDFVEEGTHDAGRRRGEEERGGEAGRMVYLCWAGNRDSAFRLALRSLRRGVVVAARKMRALQHLPTTLRTAPFCSSAPRGLNTPLLLWLYVDVVYRTAQLFADVDSRVLCAKLFWGLAANVRDLRQNVSEPKTRQTVFAHRALLSPCSCLNASRKRPSLPPF